MAFSISDIKKKIFNLLRILCATLGYAIGAFAFTVVGYSKNLILQHDLIPIAETGFSIVSLFSSYMGEVKFLFLIFLCGFCTFSSLTSGTILSFKGFACGYSAAYVWGISTHTANYICYTLSSALSLTLCAFMCRIACDLPRLMNQKNASVKKLILEYVFEFLFLCGLMLTLITITKLINLI